MSEHGWRTWPIIGYLARKNRGYYLLGYLILLVYGLWTILPIYWMLVTSVKSDAEMYTAGANLLPVTFTLSHYYSTFFQSAFPRQLLNSFIVSTTTTLMAVVFGAMAGYALTRLRFLGRTVIARLLVYSYLAPGSILFIPIFALMVMYGLWNTLHGLSLAYLTFTVPFCTWMLMGYFKSIPLELEEAALVDGASRWTVLWRIVLPLSAPALVVVAVFSFTNSWNEFLLALVLVQKKEVMTATVGLTFFQVADLFFWGAMMAASTVMALPPLLLYIIGQRWVISGWTLGAVKS